MRQFDAIRPYTDEEVPTTIRQLLGDREFLDLVAGFKAPRFSRWLPVPARYAMRQWLNREFGPVASVDALQARLSGFVEKLISASTSQLTQTGLEKLDRHTPYLFLSNHRDIVFDPLVVNYLLFSHDLETARIAIGDNLLENRLFAQLMRLNKSFIVRRNIASARDMRDAYLTLSSFICHCLEQRHSVWIAQREGRAKSGIDLTDPAIVKMFYMSQKKAGVGFSDAMNRLNIVPVSISYEFDPCDRAKARELEIRDRTGSYTKGSTEDTDQIVQGITGFKGRVHVHFGTPISQAPDTAGALAAMIDREINGNYHLHTSNLAAYGLLHGPTREQKQEQGQGSGGSASLLDGADHRAAQQVLEARLAVCPPALRPYMLAMYANPVIQAMNARASSQAGG